MIEALTAQTTTESPSLVTLLFVVLLSFVLSTALAYVYQKTYRGLSYSRTYVQSIVLISIISAMVIQAIGDSLARGLGIMAAMANIRFRTNFKDPRDTLFLFASLAAGISCGAFAFVVAILGTLSFSLAAIILYYSPLGPDKYFDGMLRFNLKANCNDNKNLNAILQQHCRSFALVTVREMEQGMRVDYAYHIKLRRGVESTQLIQQMKSLETVQQVALMMQEATVDL